MAGKREVDGGMQPIGGVVRDGGLTRSLAQHQGGLVDERSVGIVAQDIDRHVPAE